MTKAEKERLSAILHATEYLFLENIALKLVLEHRGVPNWQSLLDRLLADKEILAGVRLKFRDSHKAVATLERSVRKPGCVVGRSAKATESSLEVGFHYGRGAGWALNGRERPSLYCWNHREGCGDGEKRPPYN